MSIGSTIKRLRREKGITQEELAAKVFVTRQAVSRWETGETTPSIDMAKLLVKTFKDKGYETYIDSPTNQQFIILTRGEMERLAKDVAFSTWEWLDEDRAVVRFATSWGTTEEEIAALGALL